MYVRTQIPSCSQFEIVKSEYSKVVKTARARVTSNPDAENSAIATLCHLSEKARRDSSVASPSSSRYAVVARVCSSGRGDLRQIRSVILWTAGILSRPTRNKATDPVTKDTTWVFWGIPCVRKCARKGKEKKNRQEKRREEKNGWRSTP